MTTTEQAVLLKLGARK